MSRTPDRSQEPPALQPRGEGTTDPDQAADSPVSAADRLRSHGYTTTEGLTAATCRSCGATIPAGQARCRFCLTHRLGDTASDEHTSPEQTLCGIICLLVEAPSLHGAVAKGAAAVTLLTTGPTATAIDDCTLIYELEDDPAPQLTDQWPALPVSAAVTSTIGEQLRAAVRRRIGEGSAAEATTGESVLYDEQGQAVQTTARLETLYRTATESVWLVPAIAVKTQSDRQASDNATAIGPAKTSLECHRCGERTKHRFRDRESGPAEPWSGHPIWECRRCGTVRHGPEPQ